jgi:ribosome-associated translation inhibitor RaiA
MNAYEMADLMIQFDSGRIWEHAEEIANMLRHQADRIAGLEEENEQLYKAMDRAFEGLETMIEFSKALSKEKNK